MVAAGTLKRNQNHREQICMMGLDMMAVISELKDPSTGEYIISHVQS